ncbi:sarcosine oxidase subunit gamma [Streptomyces turgidiscabies]|uniref:Sarcosine oxidase, gamma subunit family protein n=1 Tax=Streptomyces turgidiscabies (strain Car8) TaxID=698760 RepID=L7EVL3_STRT8|nr:MULTISPECIES: sarcosine oxidase subunit gamma family protein [Streptomyces]ELP63067.1 sarcosine oxidase, gamma subunit family protein [Streptomyces turgidiscabies Car8]MDX3497689.1 sarcosine oxidase subunit gamma family protein [Streptomyces turgidiscabies]GAQ68989.1 sarcosine oxidase, gamma subunit family [Streptomyces turgidiscabies]
MADTTTLSAARPSLSSSSEASPSPLSALSPASPLADAAGRLAAATRTSGGTIRLAELPFLTQLNVRLDPKGAAADAIGLALDLPLPLAPNTVVRAGELVALWLGPDEWLIVGPPGGERDLESRIREAAGEEPVSVIDVSAQRTTLLVTGPRARDLLAHGCPLDLHPRAFGPGRCAQTTLGRTQVVLVARDEARAGFWVLVRSSFAGYLTDWLLDAAAEYMG